MPERQESRRALDTQSRFTRKHHTNISNIRIVVRMIDTNLLTLSSVMMYLGSYHHFGSSRACSGESCMGKTLLSQ